MFLHQNGPLSVGGVGKKVEEGVKKLRKIRETFSTSISVLKAPKPLRNRRATSSVIEKFRRRVNGSDGAERC